MAIGINWKEVWDPVWKPVWRQSAAPADPGGGYPGIPRGKYNILPEAYYHNTDDEDILAVIMAWTMTNG